MSVVALNSFQKKIFDFGSVHTTPEKTQLYFYDQDYRPHKSVTKIGSALEMGKNLTTQTFVFESTAKFLKMDLFDNFSIIM